MKKIIVPLVAVFCMATLANAQERIPLPEHPRPDFERSEWLNLNGEWQFTFDRQTGEKGIRDKAVSGFDLKIQVPFPWGSKLSGVENKGEVGFYGKTDTATIVAARHSERREESFFDG